MASSICARTNSKATPQYGLQFRADHRIPVPLEILACKPVSVACELSLWSRLSPPAGKRFLDARDERPQTATVGVDVAQGDFHMLIDFIIDSIRSVLLEDADVISRYRSSCHLPRPGHSFHSFRSRDGDNDATEQHGRQIAFKPN